MKPYNLMTEAELQVAVADYLRLQYPDVIFHSDFGSGVKLTPGQAAKQKRQNGGRRAWPDLEIAHPRIDKYVDSRDYEPPHFHITSPGIYLGASELGDERNIWAGLYIELKKEGTHLKKKNGGWATEHIAEQAKVLEDLRQRGYCAEFAVGFDEAKRIIDEYLGGK